mgnify:CR=1 FL=1
MAVSRDDFEEFYCPSIEWVWGDDTKSESTADCDPYEAGKSEIRRRFAIQHKYNIEGSYDVQFRLKQRDKVVASARTRVTVLWWSAPCTLIARAKPRCHFVTWYATSGTKYV